MGSVILVDLKTLSDVSDLQSFLRDILSTPSPTFHEQALNTFLVGWIKSRFPNSLIREHLDSVIVDFNPNSSLPHLCFVGHSDVVPAHFPVQIDGDFLHGAGASDMKSALGCFLWFIHTQYAALCQKYRISFVLYAREEGTPMEQNGLFSLMAAYPDFFRSVGLAIVGEPTNTTIQVGCVGSIHARIRVLGVQAHSARPWDGQNAIYKALPVIKALSEKEPVRQRIFGVEFTDVIQLTESHSEPGRTTIPGYWEGNVNFRYAPVHDPDTIEEVFVQTLMTCGLDRDQIQILDHAPCGKVIDTPFFRTVVEALECDVEAKQAWTDVAQLTQMGISAFNFGPGLTAQAHKPNEYIRLSDISVFMNRLMHLI